MSGSRTFRLFVSSTFSDLKAERNALQQHVFPRLKQLCLLTDCRFQDIDLRWGISEEAGLDQRTMRICLQEVARCQATTPRPNFVVLLGDRYGWRPLPFEMPAAEFATARAAAAGSEAALLDRWYRLDENADPPVFRLQPRERGTPEAHYPTWREKVELPLNALLGRLSPAASASATEQEIEAGALAMGADQHVFGFFRTISGFPPSGAGDFRDVLPDGTPSREPAERLAELKRRLRTRLGRNLSHYEARWLPPEQWSLPPDEACSAVVERLLRAVQSLPATRERLARPAWEQLQSDRQEFLRALPAAFPAHSGPAASRPPEAAPITLDHLPALCSEVFLQLGWIILQELADLAAADAVEGDRQAHREFGEYRSRNFIGRKATLHAIEDYLAGLGRAEQAAPLGVVGESGSGKTALLAHAADRVASLHPGTEVVVRFVGATPESADGRSLLQSICRDVARRYRLPEAEVSEDYRTLARRFPERLAVATRERPLAVFIDALDMLSAADRANALGWLPRRLPLHVALVVSTTPGDGEAAVERRLGDRRIRLDTLSLSEGARLLRRWLGDAKRRLTRNQRRAVLEGFSHSRLPLYLKLAFESAREWPSTYTAAPLGTTVSALIEALFARLSEAGNHGEQLVARSLGYLAAARHGLTEDEILDVLSRDAAVMQSFRDRSPDSPVVPHLPVVVWSRLYHDLQFYLAPQHADGTTVLTFYHQQVKRVAEAAYLSGAGRARHGDLARYYEADTRLSVEAGDRRVYNLRKLAELPYQQVLSGRWNELGDTLGSLDFLQAKVAAGAGYDAMADFERAVRLLPAAPRFEDDPHERSRAILREFGSAFNQEASAFLSFPETTGQQIYQNLFAHSGVDGPAGELLREFPGPWAGAAAWLRRLNRTPRTSISRALLRTLPAHAAEVTALAVSPDGNWIASGARDGEIRVFQRSDGAEAAGFRIENGAVAGLGWIGGAAEPLRLVSASQTGRLTLWDWEAERAEPGAAELRTRCRAIAALGDGRVVAGGDDRVVSAWKPGDPRPERLYNHQDRVLCLAADRESGRVISGGADRTVRLWVGGTALPPQRGHERPVRAVALDPDGGRAVSGDEAGIIRIWGVAGQRERRVITAHAQRVTCLAVLSRAAQVLSGSADTTIKSWDADTGQQLATLRAHTRPVSCLASAPPPDEGWFVSAGEDATVRVWQVETERRPPADSAEHEGGISALVELPDGRVASGSEDGTIRIWDAAGEHQVALRGHVGPITALLAGPGGLVSGSADCAIRRWRLDGSNRVDLWGGRPQAALAQSSRGPEVIGGATRPGPEPGAGHSRTVSSLVQAGDRVLSAGEDGTVRAWDLDSGLPSETYEPVTGALAAVQVLDNWIVGAGTPREVLLWPRRGGWIGRRLEGHESSVSCLTRLDGDRVASGGLDGTIRVWSATNAAGRVRWSHPSRVNCLAVDPEQGMLASGGDDGSVLLGPLEGGEPRRLAGHAAPVRALALHSELLVSAGDDGRINLYRPADGALVVSASLGSAVTAVLFKSPNRLWTGTRGATVALFQLELGSGR
ncbi:MAG TPA: AAA family ATPase [Gemmatimonadales bacterium]|nr:AAA family ATPase [Gemmatimonadales bacterium]